VARRTTTGSNGRRYAHCTSDTGRHTYGRPFKARPSAVCSVCGDDPIPNAGGDPDYYDRVRYDLDEDWPYLPGG
jgi:hypothetical protein